MSAKTLANAQLNLETAGAVEETVIDHTDKIRLTTSTPMRTRNTRLIKAGIARLVLWAATAALLVVTGSTAGWAEAPPCPTSPNYTPNFSLNQGCMVLNSNAAFPASSNVLQITSSTGNQVGSAWYLTPQTVVNGFTTTFQFQFTAPSSPPADGIAFVIQNTGTSAIGYTGGNGGALGYGDDDGNGNPSQGEGIPNSLAIEFDSYQNGWDPAPVDGADSHVAIQSCGAGRNTSHHGYYCGGEPNLYSTVGAATSTEPGINIADGNMHTVVIVYTATCSTCSPATTANIQVSIDGTNIYPGGVAVNLSTLLTLGSGGVAYVGFTGATGGDWETQDILSWTFTPSASLTVTELGTGIGTVSDGSQISCTETNGIQQAGSTCTGTYTPGTEVTLTASPSSTPTSIITSSPVTANGSTFLGWISGPCAGTTSLTCSFTISSTETVTADFAPIPADLSFTMNMGTNVTAQAEYACPSNTNPCTDPNAYGFSIQFPAVSTTFSPFYLVATEVYADGICPAGQVQYYGYGYPALPTTDFDCRLVYAFNYGTTDEAGDTVVPLCDAYANGNCVHFYVYYENPGTEPPTTSYTGPLFETFSFTNSTFSPGSYWAGSTTRAIADPDADEITPSVPWGTICTTAMSQEGGSGTTNPPIYCQFDADVTAFIDTGGKTNQANDFVVAFQPSATGAPIPMPSQLKPPTPVAPTIAGSCISGCTDPSGTITFTEGTGGTFVVSVPAPGQPTPYPAPNLTASTSGGALVLPNGLTYNGSTGVVSGTPADGTSGNYPVTFTATNSAGSATLNYTLTVAPAALTITASASMTYGGSVPTITPTVIGLVNGDSSSIVSCSSTVMSSSPAGSYPISCTVSAGLTYNVSCTTACGYVTVNRAPLTITATPSNATMIYGANPPTISPAFTNNGLVNGDTAMTLGVTCTTAATSASQPGSYPSSCTASNGGNYTITYVNGTVTVTGLDISPLTVNFGNLYLDQIGGQFVTLKNTTNAPITITGVTTGGGTANGDYGSLSFCPPYILVPPSPTKPASLPAGKSCAIGVGILAMANVFSPTASTTYLTITDSAATQQVLLTALVTDPQVSLSSTNLNFGNQKTGTTSSAQKVTLTNSGLTNLTLTGLTINGNFALAPTTTCTSSTMLSPGTACYIYVTFTPTTKGSKSGTVTITDHTLLGTQFIWLSGTGN